MQIRVAGTADLDDVLRVESVAFGMDKEAELTQGLLGDPTAVPTISLLAFADDGQPIGHVLFTSARVVGESASPKTMLLAPLAVVPAAQKRGVGEALTREALKLAKGIGVELVFVLGHPGYYPRFGFAPAGAQGLDAPYPIPVEAAAAWMVLELVDGAIERASGTLQVADSLMRPEHWRE
jgi:putative acetyltransferase